MAIDKVKALLKAVKTDPDAQAKLYGLVKPADEDGIVRYYAEAAKRLGFDVTEAELRQMAAEAIEEREEKTEKAAAAIQALPDDKLTGVAGGGVTKEIKHYDQCDSVVGDWTEVGLCEYTYEDFENCWLNDGCDKSYNPYDYYHCQHNSHGKTCGSKDSFDCGQFMF